MLCYVIYLFAYLFIHNQLQKDPKATYTVGGTKDTQIYTIGLHFMTYFRSAISSIVSRV